MGQKWDSRYLSKKSDTLKCMLMQHKEFKGIFLPRTTRGRQIRLHSWNRYIFGALSDVIKCVWNSNFRTSHRKWKKLFSRRKKKAESLVRLKVDLLKKGPRLRYDKEGYLLFFNLPNIIHFNLHMRKVHSEPITSQWNLWRHELLRLLCPWFFSVPIALFFHDCEGTNKKYWYYLMSQWKKNFRWIVIIFLKDHSHKITLKQCEFIMKWFAFKNPLFGWL